MKRLWGAAVAITLLVAITAGPTGAAGDGSGFALMRRLVDPSTVPMGTAGPTRAPKVRLQPEPAQFPYGVAANDVTPTSVRLWTETPLPKIFAVWGTDPSLGSGSSKAVVPVPSGHDGTIHLSVGNLSAATTYYYEFIDPATRTPSRLGTFQTAPDPNADVNLSFAFSGDQDGTIDQSTGQPCFNNFETFQAAQAMTPQFYINLGDTIYSDSRCLATPNTTVDDYRGNYKQNMSYDALRNLMASTSFYAIWDDHEVRDNFNRQTVDPTLFQNGRQAFIEYDNMNPPDPHLGFYRHFPWGQEAEIFVLDERSFRTEEADTIDSNNDGTPDCRNATTGQPDLAPTLSQSWRDFFGQQIPSSGLSDPVPPQCTTDLFATGRTMLGAAQRKQFEADLAASTAKFKLIINEDQIEQYYALPYDRWEGFQWERDQVLRFVDTHAISGVTWLTTDVHAFMAHTVDFYTPNPGDYGGVQGMEDYSVGPVATDDFRREIINTIGSSSVADQIRAFLLNVNKNTCAELGGDGNPGAPFYGYGMVQIDAATHTLTIKPYDYTNFPIAGNGVQGAGRDYFCYDYTETVP